MKHTVRLMALALLLLLALLCCACQQDSNDAPADVPAATSAAIIGRSEAASFTTESGWKAAQRIILNRCSIGVSRSDSFTFPPMQDTVMASFIHPTEPALMTINEKALDLEMTALYDAAIKQGGNLLELLTNGFNEDYMVPGTVRKKTMQVAGGTAFLMVAQNSALAGNSDMSGMGLFFTDGVLLRIGCMDNSATPDELIADLTGMMESLVVTK